MLREGAFIGVRRENGNGSFAIVGELDVATEASARRDLLPAVERGARISIDLTELTFMDSTGLSLLIDVVRAVGEEGRLELTGAGPMVRKLLQVAGLDRHPSVAVA